MAGSQGIEANGSSLVVLFVRFCGAIGAFLLTDIWETSPVASTRAPQFEQNFDVSNRSDLQLGHFEATLVACPVAFARTHLSPSASVMTPSCILAWEVDPSLKSVISEPFTSYVPITPAEPSKRK